MKSYTHVSPAVIWSNVLFIVLLGWIFTPLGLVWAAGFTGIVYLFRAAQISPQDVQSSNVGTAIYAPVCGQLIKLKDDGSSKNLQQTTISVKVPLWGPYSLAAPLKGEVIDVRFFHRQTQEFSFLSRWSGPYFGKWAYIKLKTAGDDEIDLFVSGLSGLSWPQIWVRPGDLVDGNALLGFIPFGGKVILRPGANFDLLIGLEDKILTGRSILAHKGQETL